MFAVVANLMSDPSKNTKLCFKCHEYSKPMPVFIKLSWNSFSCVAVVLDKMGIVLLLLLLLFVLHNMRVLNK
jgi:hypothetical protein